MGAAELIPGISASTVAFLLGFYPTLINQLSTISSKKLFRKERALFFLPLLLGMLISLLTFSHTIKWLLSTSISRVYTYSFFFGCCLRGVYYFRSQITHLSKKTIFFFLLGSILGISFGFFPAGYDPIEYRSFLSFIYVTLFGVLAICAALLPGISGAYILLVSGLYVKTIHSLSALFSGDLSSLLFLGNLSLGFLLGVICFSRMISFLIQKDKEFFFAFFGGTLTSSLLFIWPFSSYIHEPFVSSVPVLENRQIIFTLVCFLVGFMLVGRLFHKKKENSYQFVE